MSRDSYGEGVFESQMDTSKNKEERRSRTPIGHCLACETPWRKFETHSSFYWMDTLESCHAFGRSREKWPGDVGLGYRSWSWISVPTHRAPWHNAQLAEPKASGPDPEVSIPDNQVLHSLPLFCSLMRALPPSWPPFLLCSPCQASLLWTTGRKVH